MTNNTILNFTNEVIEFQKQQQLLIFERMKTSSEVSEYHQKNFMSNHTEENELKALKSFEFYAYDKFNMDLAIKQELEERLRIANDLLKSNGIEL